jgi:Tn3 transposase DDE domain
MTGAGHPAYRSRPCWWPSAARTRFTDQLIHAGGKVNRPPELRRSLLYVVIAEAANMGLGAMAESCGVPYDVLAWTAEWYFRPETLEAANAAIVNYHHRLPLTQAFGTGTLSSADGQRFPVMGKSITARHLSRYFARGQGISTYTHVSDQHSTFDTKVIVATAPESHYVLDGILGNETDLPITEHATDHAGATLANFALFDLVGGSSPRGSGTWGRSPCTGPGRAPSSPTGTRGAGRC